MRADSRRRFAGRPGGGARLRFLQGLIQGRHPAPPFSKATGIYLAEAQENRVVFKGIRRTPS